MTRRFVLAILVVLSAVAFARQFTGYISGDNVQIRAQGANFYERLGEFSRDAQVQVVSEKDGWCEVKLPNSVKLWVEEEYVDGDGTVNSDAAYLYAGQSTRFTKVCRLNSGAKLSVAGNSVNKMLPVYAPEQATGWVSGQFVADKPSEPILVIADEAASLAAERKALEEERQRQQQALEEEKKQLEQTREELARMQEQAKQDREELERHKEEAGRIAETKQAAMEKLASEQTAAKELSRQLDEVASENEELNNRIAEERRKQEEYRQQVEVAQIEVASIRKEAENLKVGDESVPTENVANDEASGESGEVANSAVDGAAQNGENSRVVLIAREGGEAAKSAEATAPSAEPAKPELVSCTGIVVPLGVRSTREASYAVCQLEDNKYIPLYYLSSRQLKFSIWDRQIVTVTGTVEEVEGCRYPLMRVQGVVKVR